jgi:hypothetical protein
LSIFTGDPLPDDPVAGARTTMNKGKPSRQKTTMDLLGSESTPMPKLGPDIKAKIGQQLRMMYGEVVNQGVPDRFVEILRGLDQSNDEGSKNEPS